MKDKRRCYVAVLPGGDNPRHFGFANNTSFTVIVLLPSNNFVQCDSVLFANNTSEHFGFATFTVIILQRQEELVGPSQNSIIRNTGSHDSPEIFIVSGKLQRQKSCVWTKNHGCGNSVANPASEYAELTISD